MKKFDDKHRVSQTFQIVRVRSNEMLRFILVFAVFFGFMSTLLSQGTRLLRQPNISDTHMAFTYGGDVWITNLQNKAVVRITSTPAVEKDPFLSPDGRLIAFTSNRSGTDAVYVVSINGGNPKQLTWYPSPSRVRGWSPDGKRVLYSSTRETAPTSFDRLWTVSVDGGPSKMLTAQWGTSGSFAKDGGRIVLDRVRRWDTEWRNYRGGQNTPLTILNLEDLSEVLIPSDATFDILPVWLGENIYFLSDRDWTSNIWSFSPKTGELKQITQFKGADIKWLSGRGNKLAFEREGYLFIYDLGTNKTEQLEITVYGDFPWAETKWEDVSKMARSVSLSATGKRAIMEARGEIFTVPVEYGNARNITQSSGVADRAPIWSPKGDEIAWFSDKSRKAYSLLITAQDGLSNARSISIGKSKMAWEPTWSPDGKYIAFVDDDVRIRVLDVKAGTIKTVDVGGNNMERGQQGLCWAPDSKWLAYSKTGANNFRQILVWSQKDNSVKALTNPFADAYSPSWDRDGRHLYFLASTELALGSGWANTSSMTADPTYAVYVINLRKKDPSPFNLRSDEEPDKKDDVPTGDKKKKKQSKKKDEPKEGGKEVKPVLIDFDGIDRRIIAIPMPERNYLFTVSGPSGSVFIGERKANAKGLTIHKFSLKERKAKEFIAGAGHVSVSGNGKKMLAKVNNSWMLMSTAKSSDKGGETLKVSLKMKLDRAKEWHQIFEEAWRYERDYFYDPNMHGRDWDEVHSRYAPLVPFIKHRVDLSYILDQVNGELSVGHSFVFGGDFPKTANNMVGLLGADLVIDQEHWKIKRIFTTESWNPKLSSPLSKPGINVQEGYYILKINGKELDGKTDVYKMLDGTAGQQTVLHVNKTPDVNGAWKIIVKPIRSEYALRQRAWVEDNRRLVDKLSGGKIAYVWVPNTSGGGFVSFNRYFFAQQDKEAAVIDERFNGGGLLDDYMVDLMTRKLRAALTNEVPNGTPFRLPAGILGPKVLLVNEMSGSGGDYFPWVFRQQNAGPLVGTTTWGGLVKSSVHYSLIDGGALTAPDNAVYDPIKNEWVAENKGIAPDIKVRQDAVSVSKGLDPQLERAVKEVLLLLEKQEKIKIDPPPFSSPAIKK